MKYNSSTVYYYLNNYDYSPDNIEKVRKFLETGAYPENILTPAKKRHYANRWKNFEWKQCFKTHYAPKSALKRLKKDWRGEEEAAAETRAGRVEAI
jgi:hypothetical protein